MPRDPLNNKWTDWVYLDPDRVDLIVQHKLRNMDYYELIQEAGDCIFIPFAMLHQVQKLDEGLQVAASWMFLPETIYEEDVCEKAPLQEDLPLAAMDTLFMYSGKGLIPQGYQDPLNFVNKLLQYMDDANEEHLTLETFTRTVTEGDAILRRIRNNKKKIKNLYKRIIAHLGGEYFTLYSVWFGGSWCWLFSTSDVDRPSFAVWYLVVFFRGMAMRQVVSLLAASCVKFLYGYGQNLQPKEMRKGHCSSTETSTATQGKAILA